MSFFFFCFLTFSISRKRLTDDLSTALYSSLFSEWQYLSWWFRDSVTTPSINDLFPQARRSLDFALWCCKGGSDGLPQLSQSGGGSLCVVWGPPCSELPLACCRCFVFVSHYQITDRWFGSVRAQGALELASEYVIFTVFRVNIKHGKSFKGYVWMCFFLKLQQTRSTCSLTMSHGVGVVSFASFV